jgi:hypothetical protein
MADSPPSSDEPQKLPAGWAVVPVVSVGFLSWVPFVYAATRTRARKYQIFTAVYLALAIVAGVLVSINHGNGTTGGLGGLILIAAAAGGCAHVISIRNEYGRLLAASDDPRLLMAEHRVELRERALEIAKSNPKRALELGVGRPDVPGSFDGGLIDVNHAGAEALTTLPGIDREKAKRIIELRMNGTGFESAEDLDMVLDLDPGTLADLSRSAVFLPRF